MNFYVAILSRSLSAVLLCSCSSLQSSEIVSDNSVTEQWIIYFVGRWSPNCYAPRGFNIKNNGNAIIEVNSNQIYINSHIVYKNDKTIYIVLDSPEDLGRGGMNLNWESFSTSLPVADFTLTSNNTAIAKWHGFYDKSVQDYLWVKEPDFVDESDTIELSKCEN